MSIIDRVRDVVVLSNNQAILELSLDLRDRPKEEQRARFFGSPATGFFYLHTNDAKRPGMVYECIVTPNGSGETISTLYMAHPIFASVGELQRTRLLLCEALGQKVGLDYRNIGIFDPSRGREVGVEDLCTAALIDLLLEHNRNVGTANAETESYGMRPELEGKVATVKGEVGREKLKHVDVLTMQEDGTFKAVPLGDN